MDVPFEKRFHFRNGESAGNLEELRTVIESLSYQEFYHHVNTSKNDFANWISFVLHDEQLADELKKVTSIVETVEIINDRLHPLPLTAPHTDAQSRIEEEILGAVPQAEALTSEPTTVIVAAKEPSLDFKIIEESITHPEITQKAQEELFNRVPEPAKQQEIDATRLIVKDFMYGLVFGLILGFIIRSIMSF